MDINKPQKEQTLPGSKDTFLEGESYIAVRFNGRKKVLSSAPHNGGMRTDLTAVYNFDGKQEGNKEISLQGGTYESHMQYVSKEIIGLDPDTSAGIMTAASMRNAVFLSESFCSLTVTAIVTGGIEVNGARAGDPTEWCEERGYWEKVSSKTLGTINIMLFIHADLADGALAKALITCTEAKAAAIQELCISSRYSWGIATGSGTDGVILVSDMDASLHLTETGSYSKAGELIGRVVKRAVKEALFRQSGVGASVQHDALRRLGRFGLTEDVLTSRIMRLDDHIQEQEAVEKVHKWKRSSSGVLWAVLEACLLEQRHWGLLDWEETERGRKKCLEILQPEDEHNYPEIAEAVRGWQKDMHSIPGKE